MSWFIYVFVCYKSGNCGCAQ